MENNICQCGHDKESHHKKWFDDEVFERCDDCNCVDYEEIETNG